MSGFAQNERGQGMSHASAPSKLPEGIQRQLPKSVEEALPESIHPTEPKPAQSWKSTNVSHAKGGGEASILPQKVQEMLPEGVERAAPNVIHDTGDPSATHSKQ
ncbi:hypothetical protein BKA59DRAFT_126101 [Fusarium tricinctum]|uniref:Uncharacterized protein n=2 Tax=Fusarium tricinctum species complex TaxID=679429 RepID=A0A8K0S2L5_9HYPO|nr:hypothetical protein BKA59DRAFT_126101 [Fusarium tricinctum]